MLILALAMPARADDRPNVVLYVLDDADARLFELTPGLMAIGAEGVRFSATVPAPLCAPSRASILTGLHVHNHGVNGNRGGASAWAENGNGRTVADWFRAVGYTTARFGKWINDVPRTGQLGWDLAVSPVGRGSKSGPVRYWLDQLTQDAVDLVAATPGPFLLYFAPGSPHAPFIPSPAYFGLHEHAALPSCPSFNEANVSDKRWKVHPLLTKEQIAKIVERHRRRREMMESIADSVNALRAVFAGRPTYLVITSDHGYLEGQHRYGGGKGKHFDEATQVPLWILGPSVVPGNSPALVYPLDIAPTVAELAGVPTPELDGRSLVPLLIDPLAPWRERVVLEHGYKGVRTARHKLVTFRGESELYDLRRDPFEMRNRCEIGSTTCGAQLFQFIPELTTCRGAQCWEVETRPGSPSAQSPPARGWCARTMPQLLPPRLFDSWLMRVLRGVDAPRRDRHSR